MRLNAALGVILVASYSIIPIAPTVAAIGCAAVLQLCVLTAMHDRKGRRK